MAKKKVVARKAKRRKVVVSIPLPTALKQGQTPGLHAGGVASDAVLEALYRANSGVSEAQARRALWNAGWYEGAGVILKAKVGP